MRVVSVDKNHTQVTLLTNAEKDLKFDEERRKNLEKLREKYMPIDFNAIKEHERSFLANAYMKKQQRDQDLKSKLKSMESAYKPQMSQTNLSKAYVAAREEYHNSRHTNNHSKRIAESMESRDRIKKYNEKLRMMNAIEENIGNGAASHVQSKLPGPPLSKAETGYGRFGKEWTKKINKHEDDQKQLEAIKEKGMEYLRFGKSKALKKDEKTIEEKIQEETEEKKKEAQKSLEIGKEYLKFAKSKAVKGKGLVSEHPGIGSDVQLLNMKGDEKAFVKARLEKMDGDIHMIEAKIRNKMISKDSIELENAYLKNIKAKLDLLEEL